MTFSVQTPCGGETDKVLSEDNSLRALVQSKGRGEEEPMRLLLKRTVPMLMLLAMVASAGIAQNRVTWSEFSMRVTPRHSIRMVLPDGTAIEGSPLEMKPEGMEIRIRKTSNRQAHPKGVMTIPRVAVTVVEVRTPRSRGKIIGTLAPIGVGIALVATAYGRGDDTYVRLFAGGLTMAGGGVGGFFIGRAVDRRFEQVVIAAEK